MEIEGIINKSNAVIMNVGDVWGANDFDFTLNSVSDGDDSSFYLSFVSDEAKWFRTQLPKSDWEPICSYDDFNELHGVAE